MKIADFKKTEKIMITLKIPRILINLKNALSNNYYFDTLVYENRKMIKSELKYGWKFNYKRSLKSFKNCGSSHDSFLFVGGGK